MSNISKSVTRLGNAKIIASIGAALSPIQAAFPTPPALGAHRYWHLRALASDGAGVGITAISELYFLDSGGNVIAGTYTANGTSGGNANVDLKDGNVSTFWYYFNTNGEITIDAGSPVTVETIRMASRNGGFAKQTPSEFTVAWSDDNITKTDVLNAIQTHWAQGQYKRFPLRPYILRIEALGNSQNGNSIITWAENEIHAVAAGPDITEPSGTGSGIPQEISAGRIFQKLGSGAAVPDGAFDNNVNDYTGNTGLAHYAEYRFETLPTLYEMNITARNSGGFYIQSPSQFKIRLSRDGITYFDYITYTPATFTNGQVQTFVF